MSNDQHILGWTIMCPIKHILTWMKAFAEETHVHARPVEVVYVFWNLSVLFYDFYINNKKTLKKTLFSVFFTFDMSKIPQNLSECYISMINAGMTMNAVATNIGCSTRAIRHVR